VTYKADVGDVRGSPAIAVLERLAAAGAKVSYHDPLVPSIEMSGRHLRSRALDPADLATHDVTVVLTAHSTVDFREVVRHAPLVFDARGVTRGRRSNVVRL
jgi:UDP-N-acetyl-D-glucosamine dehydrogenase